MEFVTKHEHGTVRHLPIRFGDAVCGMGFDELILTADDIHAMQNMSADQIGDYFQTSLCTRLLLSTRETK